MSSKISSYFSPMVNIVFLFLLWLVVSTTSEEDGDTNEDLFPRDCGRRPLIEEAENELIVSRGGKRLAKIVSGEDVTFGEYPWQVHLDIFQDQASLFCGGSIINSKWIVSAAHCFDGLPQFVFALLGELNKNLTNEPLPRQVRSVLRVIKHPKYISSFGIQHGYDIALLRLENSINFQPHIQPICLPTLEDMKNIEGKTAYATGWGDIYSGEPTSLLQEAPLTIIAVKHCKEIYADLSFTKIDNSTVCAGYINGKIVTCSGDSGGPLQIEGKNGRWLLIGANSWSRNRCGIESDVAVYTKISHHLPWIRRVLMYVSRVMEQTNLKIK